MATVFSTLYRAFYPLRTPKSLQLPFWCLGCTESRETSGPDFIRAEPPPPEVLSSYLSPVFSLQNPSFPFYFQPHIAWMLLCSFIPSPLVLRGVKMGVNKGFISGCPVWLLVGKKFPVLSCLSSLCSVPVPDTREATASFIATATGRLSRDGVAMKSSKEGSS